MLLGFVVALSLLIVLVVSFNFLFKVLPNSVRAVAQAAGTTAYYPQMLFANCGPECSKLNFALADCRSSST